MWAPFPYILDGEVVYRVARPLGNGDVSVEKKTQKPGPILKSSGDFLGGAQKTDPMERSGNLTVFQGQKENHPRRIFGAKTNKAAHPIFPVLPQIFPMGVFVFQID